MVTGLIETQALPNLGLNIGDLTLDEKAELLFLDQRYECRNFHSISSISYTIFPYIHILLWMLCLIYIYHSSSSNNSTIHSIMDVSETRNNQNHLELYSIIFKLFGIWHKAQKCGSSHGDTE